MYTLHYTVYDFQIRAKYFIEVLRPDLVSCLQAQYAVKK